jgi:hypothetical protein
MTWRALSAKPCLCRMDSRSLSLVCAISRTNIATSNADAVLVSPRKSINRCTTDPADSQGLAECARFVNGCHLILYPLLSPVSSLHPLSSHGL